MLNAPQAVQTPSATRTLTPGLRLAALVVAAGSLAAVARGQMPPEIVHQPAHCTVPDRAVSVCAEISDADGMVMASRVYFRSQGEDHFSYVEMTERDSGYCATLPAPRRGKVKVLEYYLHAIDDSYEPQRTLPFLLELQDPEVCGFPPLENDPARAAAITVFATHRRQRDQLDDRFVSAGVTFVPKR